MESRHIFHLTNINIQTRSHTVSLGIRKNESLRCYRRSRAGKSISNWIKVLLTEHHGSKILCPQNRKVIKIERYIPKPKELSMCLINPRSVTIKQL